MRVLVAGANGLLGSRVWRLATQRGHEAVGLGRGACRVDGQGQRYLPCDLTSAEQVDAAIRAVAPDTVVQTASLIDVDGCEQHRAEAYRANVTAAANLAAACSAVGAHLVHVSTDYVFDGERGDYSEDDVPNPRGVYAVTKWLGEEAVRLLAPHAAIARTSVLYDWPQAARSNFGAWLVSALGKGEPVRLFEDQVVSPTLASHLAEMVLELGERRLAGTWHTTGAEPVNRVQFAEALCDVFGFDRSKIVRSRLAEAKLASPRPKNSGLSVTKARAQLGARPLALAESLRRFHAAWLESGGPGGIP